MTATGVQALGASAAAIAQHYDTGNDFFRLWLDQTMTYTCALWDETTAQDALEAAQVRQIDWHAHQARAAGARRVLDVGCGWGGALQRLVEAHGVEHAVGLTLSGNQVAWVAQSPTPHLEVRYESWADHTPEAPYDAVISIEAIEAFARLGLSVQEKVEVYRTFFARCHAWLQPGGWLSLQAITYGNAGPQDFDAFIASEIFPESDLPRLAELAEAIERLFEIVTLCNDRHHYVRTLKAWRARLRANRTAAVTVVGEETVVRFERYLHLAAAMFTLGTCDLYRIVLRRIDSPRRRGRSGVNLPHLRRSEP